MNDIESLHKAILQNPEEDTPRLAYADCIEEYGPWMVKCERCEGSGTGEHLKSPPGLRAGACPTCSGRGEIDRNAGCHERAELIRIGCWLASEIVCHQTDRLDCNQCQQHKEYKDHESQLIELGRKLGWWDVGLGGTGLSVGNLWWPSCGVTGTVARGFVDSITLTTALFDRHAAAIFVRQPVTRCTLRDKRPIRQVIRGAVQFDWFDKSECSSGFQIDPQSDLNYLIFNKMWEAHPENRGTTLYIGRRAISFDTESASNLALSASACHVGRNKAGIQEPTLMEV